jgi:hypothetical protein
VTGNSERAKNISEPEMKELWGEWRQLYKEKLHIIYSSPKTGLINVAGLETQEKRIKKFGQKTERKKNTSEISK